MQNSITYVVPFTGSKDKPKNVSLLPNDPGSRYKTRQLQVHVTGKNKMMKTVLTNLVGVAKDMQVNPSCTVTNCISLTF
jgi:hypothetical protein